MSEDAPKYNAKAKTIFRIEKNKNNPYVMIDRRLIENPALSWKAKGLLAYLLSRPDDWTVRFRDIVKHSPDGGHTVRVAMKELRDAGHVKVIAEREHGRVKQWVYTIYESPDVEFQQVEILLLENRTLNNKDINKDEKEERDSDGEIFVALENLTGSLNTNTPKFVDAWKEHHSSDRILQAIGAAKENGARSVKYVDEILITWEANGYPKTREQRVQEKKAKPSEPIGVTVSRSWLEKKQKEHSNGQ